MHNLRAVFSISVAILLGIVSLSVQARSYDEFRQKGVKLFESEQYREAKEVFNSVLSRNPNDEIASSYLGRILFIEEDFSGAIDRFKKAVELDPRNVQYHIWLGRAYAEEAQRAGMLRKLSIIKKAGSSFEKAVAIDPEDLQARMSLMEYYRRVPGIAGGSSEKAKEQANEIRKRDRYRGYIAFAIFYEGEKDHNRAEAEYREAMKYYPDSTYFYYNLGLMYSRTERYDDAFALFEDLARTRPSEIRAYYYIGRTGAVSGQRLDRAEEALLKFLSLSSNEHKPWIVATHWRLGTVYEKKGDKARARKQYQEALALNPNHKESKSALDKLK